MRLWPLAPVLFTQPNATQVEEGSLGLIDWQNLLPHGSVFLVSEREHRAGSGSCSLASSLPRPGLPPEPPLPTLICSCLPLSTGSTEVFTARGLGPQPSLKSLKAPCSEWGGKGVFSF